MTLKDWEYTYFDYPGSKFMKRWVLQLSDGPVLLETYDKGVYNLKFGYGMNPIAVFRAKDDDDAYRVARKHIINELRRRQAGIADDLEKIGKE